MSPRRRKSKGVPSEREIRAKHRELCSKDEHVWQPVILNHKWNKKYLRCYYCRIEGLYKELTNKDERWMVRQTAKTLEECHAKVRALHG